MAIASDSLIKKLKRNPDANVRLIVRTKDDLSVSAEMVRAAGLSVRRTFSLISAVAVEGPASAALRISKETWVLSIEEDTQVHTM